MSAGRLTERYARSQTPPGLEATPLTDILCCTDPIADFESLSYHQRWHAQTYVTGLIGSSNKTIQGIASHVLPAKYERTLNNFLNDYEWDEDRLNRERIAMLQEHNDTRMAEKGVVAIDDTLTEKTGRQIPGADWFFDHTEGHTVWSQNLVWSLYADRKTAYPLDFRQKQKDGPSKIDLAKELVDQVEGAGTPASTYVYDGWFCCKELNEYVESTGKDWLTLLPVNRLVKYGGEWIRVDELRERVDLTERTVDGDTYKIWTKKLAVNSLNAEKKVLLVEQVADGDDEQAQEAASELAAKTAEPAEDEEADGDEPVVRCILTSKIDVPAEHLIRLYLHRWRIETFFKDTKQDLGLAACEVRTDRVAKRHWHLVMLAYSVLRRGVAHSALGTANSTASSVRGHLKHALKEALYNLLHWAMANADRSVESLMQEVEGVFI